MAKLSFEKVVRRASFSNESRPLIPEGDYVGRIVDLKWRSVPDQDKPKILMTLSIFDEKYPQFFNEKVYASFDVFSPKEKKRNNALNALFDFQESLGFDLEYDEAPTRGSDTSVAPTGGSDASSKFVFHVDTLKKVLFIPVSIRLNILYPSDRQDFSPFNIVGRIAKVQPVASSIEREKREAATAATAGTAAFVEDEIPF